MVVVVALGMDVVVVVVVAVMAVVSAAHAPRPWRQEWLWWPLWS